MIKALSLFALLAFTSPALAGTALLTWKDNSNNEDGFIVERRDNVAGAAFVEIGRVTANTSTYTDTIQAGKSVVYRVLAYNSEGKSAPSNEAVFTAKTAPSSPTDLTVQVQVTVTIEGK